MTTFTLYHADCVGQPQNCLYPHAVEVTDAKSLSEAVRQDYVCAAYAKSYRSNENFLHMDCIGLDCDNDHSENPDDWKTPEDVRKAFPDMAFAVHFSRHHMKLKNGKPARPKFHCFLPTGLIANAKECARLKQVAHELFPFFDTKALDAARFFYGTPDAQVDFFPGELSFADFLDYYYPEHSVLTQGNQPRTIPQGSRNATLSHFAGRVLKRYGDSSQAYGAFLEEAAKCDPPLEDTELATIWHSAQGFYKKVARQEGYVTPDAFNSGGFLYLPEDCTDVGQARLLGKYFANKLRYSPATDYIRYDGACWQETRPGAQSVAHELTDRQLEESEKAIKTALPAYESTGAQELMGTLTKKKALLALSEEQQAAYEKYSEALAYNAFALQRRDSKYVTATLKEAHPVLEIDPAMLDKDWFLLCTPDATYDLRKGLEGKQPHNPENFITHMTSVSPGEKGAEIWKNALNTFFCGDQELIRYVQCVAGVVCVGQVFLEAMIIAYGDGRNGKSTFWNTLARVMGSYSGNISADSLTASCKRNVKPEMAETRGKRLLIAAEMEEGMRLNTSTVKQLTSTDNVFAEKKYKDPFSFTPSHTLVLYTNHLPKVGALDEGIWRRLIVLPFNAKIEGKSDIKNYTDYLYQNAGESIMAWMIDGAKQAITMGFKPEQPPCVVKAIEAYREQNNWLGHFLTDCCEIGEGLVSKSGELYYADRAYCGESNEYVRSTTDFYAALEAEGFTRQKLRSGMVVKGLSYRPASESAESDFSDFLA